QDVPLDAEVVRHHVQALIGADRRARRLGPERAFIPLIAALGAHDLRKVHALQARELARDLHRRGFIHLISGHDAARLRALLPENARQLAGVDARDRDYLTALEEFAQRLVRAPVARNEWQIADDETGRIDLRSFQVLGRRSGVTDVRNGERHDLTRVG